MKKLAIALIGAVSLAAVASAAHAEPSFSGKDREELYRVLRQQSEELRGERYIAAPRYYRNDVDNYGAYEQYRPYAADRYYEGRRYRRVYREQ